MTQTDCESPSWTSNSRMFGMSSYNRTSNFCTDCPSGVYCWEKSVFPMCSSWSSPTDCAYLGGTYDAVGSMCQYPMTGSSTYTDCYPPAIFGTLSAPTTQWMYQQGMCTYTSIGSQAAGCNATLSPTTSPSWSYSFGTTRFANGKCSSPLYYASNMTAAKEACLAAGSGAAFAEGRQFQAGQFSTASSCTAGYCSLNLPNANSMTAAQCTSNSACSLNVQKCGSWEPLAQVGGCFNLTATSQSLCVASSNAPLWYDSGFYSSYPGCQLTASSVNTSASCAALGKGASWLSCDQSTTRSACETTRAAASPAINFVTTLQQFCSWDLWPTYDQTECTTKAGSCSDDDLWMSTSGEYPNGICVANYQTDSYGNLNCMSSQSLNQPDWTSLSVSYSQLGCLLLSVSSTPITTLANCTTHGGRALVSKAKSQTNCTADSSKFVCYDSSGITNVMNQSECQKCNVNGYTWGSPYTWTAGKWTTGTMTPMQWKQRKWGSVNNVTTSAFNWQAYSTYAHGISNMKIGQVMADAFAAKYFSMGPLLQKVSCACTNSGVSSCGLTSAPTTILGAGETDKNGNVNAFGVSVNASALGGNTATITVTSTPLLVTVTLSGSRRLGEESGSSHRRLATGTTTYSQLCTTGTPSTCYGTQISAGRSISSTVTVSGSYQLCLTYDAAAASSYNNQTYPVLDFAIGTSYPVGQALNLVVTRDSSLSYCATVSSTGVTYFAVARMSVIPPNGMTGSITVSSASALSVSMFTVLALLIALGASSF